MASFMELAKKRYSVRKYSDRPVEQEVLDRILEAGNIAPTAKNSQAHRIYVIRSEEAIEKLDSLTNMRYGAPMALLFAYNRDEEFKCPIDPDGHSGDQDASIVATHIMLEAAELGLGTVWCAHIPNAEMEKAFGLPANEHALFLLPLGYPAEDSEPSPRHFEKRPIGETVKYL